MLLRIHIFTNFVTQDCNLTMETLINAMKIRYPYLFCDKLVSLLLYYVFREENKLLEGYLCGQ